MHEATVCYPSRGLNGSEEWLMGKRVSLFANEKWNGPGGKLKHKREKIVTCLCREVREETTACIARESLTHISSIDFYKPHKDGFRLGWRVHFYVARAWMGKFVPLNEFSEFKWYPRHALPYDIMMPDSKYWIPLVEERLAQGRIFVAEIFNDANGEMVEMKCRYVSRDKSSTV